METKKISTRGRPKKDYWELKSKLAQETAENKWKLSRWRPKKQRNIEDSINTKISNHHKDVTLLEKKNQEIHKDINAVTNNYQNSEQQEWDDRAEKFSKVALCFAVIFCIFAVAYRLISFVQKQKTNELIFSEIENTWDINNSIGDGVQMQIWYNNESWEFIEIENIEINDNNIWLTNNTEINNNEPINIEVEANNIDNEDVVLIQSFYEKINNREFSELASLADRYLKNSDAYRTYFSSNWLNNFLDKITGNRIFIWWFSESLSDKPNVKNYKYTVKYKVNADSQVTNEEWEIAIVDRNWEKLIWSIMCITTWCSKMPFFQK